MNINEIEINTEFIKLDSFMKLTGMCSMGSEAKPYILSGKVKVNQEVELRRGRKLRKGDIVEFNNDFYKII